MIKYLVTILLIGVAPCFADVRLPKILNSHMVLQQNSEVKIWGWADPGEDVSVQGDWLSEPIRFKANAEGEWQAQLQTGEAGGPHDLTISGTNQIHLTDVLFGEVWIGSGQSNMEMPLIKVSDAYSGVKDAKQEVANAEHPEIRLFQVGNFSSKEPLDDVELGIEMYGVPTADCQWRASSPETIPTFSSTAYFFARELHRQLRIPIGVIDASWGGTSAETWTPTSGLEELAYKDELDQALNLPQKANEKIPSRLYNGMIHPLRDFRIRGVIWYQGEGNAGRADKYHKLFSTMISGWRKVFGYEFPFYFAQISPFQYRDLNAAYLREAQMQTLSLPHTGMAVTMDIGNLADIHPKNKQEVGRRLALWALAKQYGRDVEYSGPLYKAKTVQNGRIRVKFDHVGGGLATRDGKAPSHLEIAGSDKVFHPATATIEGDELVVVSDKVAAPRDVRYAFTTEATPNLMNTVGLPASSFRTDSW